MTDAGRKIVKIRKAVKATRRKSAVRSLRRERMWR